jgi:hypothetical protein
MNKRPIKIYMPIITCFLLITGTPKDAKAQILEGALIGAGIGAVVGLIFHFVQKKPVEKKTFEDDSAQQDTGSELVKIDSLQVKGQK